MIRKPRIKRRRYWAVRIDGKYILEHRYVMEQHLGRKLLDNEIVHHINGDPEDNRVENLEIFTNPGEHLRHHRPDLADIQREQFKGKHFSPETEFTSERLKGNKYREGKEPWNKGRAWTPEERAKLSEAHKGAKSNSGSFKAGFVPWNKGKKGWKKGEKNT